MLKDNDKNSAKIILNLNSYSTISKQTVCN